MYTDIDVFSKQRPRKKPIRNGNVIVLCLNEQMSGSTFGLPERGWRLLFGFNERALNRHRLSPSSVHFRARISGQKGFYDTNTCADNFWFILFEL